MNLLAKKLKEARKTKGLTQEELAEQSQVNLRTIQRIENSESEPRGKTLSLICDTLQINLNQLVSKENLEKEKTIGSKIINGLFLLAFNLMLMGIIGYLTLDSNANMNSIFGGVLVSFLLPFFIVIFTKEMNETKRLLKFGVGYMTYFILVLINHGFPTGFLTGLFPCLLLSLTVLYFGSGLLKKI
ncbi:helix-turn-helix domain-containing protein [Mesonia sp.]|uniref:helix-turn-helix domain-containing protein n=1 Tax=Mesonia sp. TaxID=1960830 RepID=UPI003F966DF6